MTDLLYTFLLHTAGLLAFAALLRLSGHRVAVVPLLAAIGATAMLWTAEVLGAPAQAHIPGMSRLDWNWMGKVFAIVFTLAMAAAVPRMTRLELGLTWRQRPGWLVPVLLVMAATCGFSWIAEALSHDDKHLTIEKWLFEATMPGLDEELFWRGLLLALLTRAFGVGKELARGTFGYAETAITLLFAAAHGLRISHGAIAFDAETFFVTGTIGAALMWLRTRTGSLLIPVLTHNLVNVGNQFF